VCVKITNQHPTGVEKKKPAMKADSAKNFPEKTRGKAREGSERKAGGRKREKGRTFLQNQATKGKKCGREQLRPLERGRRTI